MDFVNFSDAPLFLLLTVIRKYVKVGRVSVISSRSLRKTANRADRDARSCVNRANFHPIIQQRAAASLIHVNSREVRQGQFWFVYGFRLGCKLLSRRSSLVPLAVRKFPCSA